MSALADVMLTRVEGTTLTYGDLCLIGHSLLNAAAASVLMRHESPAGITNYAEPDSRWDAIVNDFIDWTAQNGEAESQERLHTYLIESGWMDQMIPSLGAAA